MNCAIFPIKKCCDMIKQAHEKGEIALATDKEDTSVTLVYWDQKEKYSDNCIFCNTKLVIDKTDC